MQHRTLRRRRRAVVAIASGTTLASAVAAYALRTHHGNVAAMALWCTLIGAAHLWRVLS